MFSFISKSEVVNLAKSVAILSGKTPNVVKDEKFISQQMNLVKVIEGNNPKKMISASLSMALQIIEKFEKMEKMARTLDTVITDEQMSKVREYVTNFENK